MANTKLAAELEEKLRRLGSEYGRVCKRRVASEYVYRCEINVATLRGSELSEVPGVGSGRGWRMLKGYCSQNECVV